MRVSMLVLALGLGATAVQGQPQPGSQPALDPVRSQSAAVAGTATTTLTLQEAVRIAETANPNVRAREAQLPAGEGLRTEASSLFAHNPELSFEQARRKPSNGDSSFSEQTVGLSQAIEIGGQQARRREAAAATVDALRLELEDARRQARTDATLRFHAVLVAQRRVAIEQRAQQLFDTTSQAIARRRSVGEDTRLDANVALIEAERARNSLAVAREQLLDARVELATVLQLPPAQLPELASDSALASAAARTDLTSEQLLQSVQGHPRLRALAAREAAARARLAVEQAKRLPDVTLGVNYGREGPSNGREKVTTFTLGVPLPVFNRNSAAIGQAIAEVGQAEVDRLSGVRDTEAQVRRLWSRLLSQRDRVLRLQQSILAAAQDNQQLATRSRQAGQIGLLDQLVVNRQALDAERELLEAQAEFDNTRIELERAAAWPQEGISR